MRNTPEKWAELQAGTDAWAAGATDKEILRMVQSLQVNWKLTGSRDSWDLLQCLYAVQHRRSFQ